MEVSQCKSLKAGLILAFIIVLTTSRVSYCSRTERYVPRQLLGAQQAGTSAAGSGNVANAASCIEHLVLWHRSPSWGQNATSSSPAAAANASMPVNFTIYYPAKPVSPQQQHLQDKLPVLFLLNGANVEAEQYSTLAGLLNQLGYIFVASNYYQPLSKADEKMLTGADSTKNWTFPASCPKDKLLGSTAALIQTFTSHIRSQTPGNPAFSYFESRGLVLVGHSMGGAVATNILGQKCLVPDVKNGPASSISYCEGYQPPLRTATCTASSDHYKTANSSGGGTSSSAGLIRGLVLYEGYRSQLAPQSEAHDPAALTTGPYVFLPTGEVVPPGMFLLLLSGQYGASKVQRVYKLSTASSCSCIGLATFAGLNHFGINNHQPNTTAQGIRQLTPCGRPASSDPVGFRVTEANQSKQLQNMASLIDAFIQAQLFGSKEAKKQLQQLAETGGSSSSSNSREFRLQAKPGCLR